jgi:hypothetical protein
MITMLPSGFLLLWDTGYEARHRSRRQASPGVGRLGQRRREYPFGAAAGWRSRPGSPVETSWMPSPLAAPEFPDRPEGNQLHRMLQDCALDDLAGIIPEIVEVIARSSAGTMTSAWNDFREAAWNARALRIGPGLWAEELDPCLEDPDPYPDEVDPYPEEDAVVIKVGQAPDALWLITNAPRKLSVHSP